MANQYNNKVVLGNETLIDLTSDTATESDVISGKSFHLASGAPATGSLGIATQSSDGLMSSSDKTKVDDMAMITFGTCSTAADVQHKVVTLSNDKWQLKVGSIVGVKFEYSNTYSATATSHVTLNVNNTGAKNIHYGADLPPTGTNTTAFGRAGYICYYMYDGWDWIWLSTSADNNTTYSIMSVAEGTTGTATSARTMSAANLKNIINASIEDRVLWLPSVTVSAKTGNIVDLSYDKITTDHVLAWLKFANNASITALNSWSTDTAGKLTISGTCTAATTAQILLIKKGN